MDSQPRQRPQPARRPSPSPETAADPDYQHLVRMAARGAARPELREATTNMGMPRAEATRIIERAINEGRAMREKGVMPPPPGRPAPARPTPAHSFMRPSRRSFSRSRCDHRRSTRGRCTRTKCTHSRCNRRRPILSRCTRRKHILSRCTRRKHIHNRCNHRTPIRIRCRIRIRPRDISPGRRVRPSKSGR